MTRKLAKIDSLRILSNACRLRGVGWLICSIGFVLSIPATSIAADIEVTTLADSGTGSLREAVTTAVAGDRVVFNISGGGTITLASNLPDITNDLSFTNSDVAAVVIDLNGNSAVSVDGAAVDLGEFQVTSVGAGVNVSAAGTLFGDTDPITANLVVEGTIAPGDTDTDGVVGTLNIVGTLDATHSTIAVDVVGGTPGQSDLIDASGNVTITDSTLRPNFVGSNYATGDAFTVINSATSVTGVFANAADTFALPSNPFLEATIAANPSDVQLVVQDNGLTFAAVVEGCNQTVAAMEFDRLQVEGSVDQMTTIAGLRSGSTDLVNRAVNQISGTIYPSLVDGEINQIQNNLHSVRDRVLLQRSNPDSIGRQTPWVRGFGMTMSANEDRCSTLGYRQSVGGIELGTGWLSANGLGVHGFAQVSSSDMSIRGSDQTAESESYRLGGTLQYAGDVVYVLGAGGFGYQDHDVKRSTDVFTADSQASSSLDGTDQFGYVECGLAHGSYDTMWLNFVSLQGIRVDLDSAAETGGSDFNLNVNGIDDNSLRSMVGFSLSKSNPTALGPATTQVRVGWLHEFFDDNRQAQTLLSSAAITNQYSVESASVDRDWLSLGGQLDWGFLLGGQFTLAYQGNINTRSAFQTGLAGVRWMW
ncbi:Autotransporter beta-domain protein [Rubripirellula tenax]|uniref:Autotransporter beta-domain protein n=1 Tax=Rubripirellula tenax TaxID=2528015 RepID=A0A5C6EN56_9BACT|nr:autotransporter outer membrane beta-barrel domain-containing protein [Rubripirellula tenax]TWU48759.1 Autotransporter beta-domain protein [Rubripirellula tenax]